jgi:hypothetical protein
MLIMAGATRFFEELLRADEGAAFEAVPWLTVSHWLALAVILAGGRQRAINIYVDTDKLTAYNLSMDEVRGALIRQNMEVPGGRVDQGSREVVLRTMGRVATPADFRELIIANQGENFSAGANLMMVLLAAQEGEWDEIEFAVRAFQRMTAAIKFCPRPVVVAPFGFCLGGGAEMALHAVRRNGQTADSLQDLRRRGARAADGVD